MGNDLAAMAYLTNILPISMFGWVSGLAVYFVAKDKTAKFHGMQAMLLAAAQFLFFLITGALCLLLAWIPLIFLMPSSPNTADPASFLAAFLQAFAAMAIIWVLFAAMLIVNLLALAANMAVSLWLAVKALEGKIYKLPIIGNWAEMGTG
jgi:uncharacterized membrane protein